MTDEPTPAVQPNDTAEAGSVSATVSAPAVDDLLVEEDLLVEDVSIDGMCGVY